MEHEEASQASSSYLLAWISFVESALKAESISMICSKLHTGHIAKGFMKEIKGGTALDKKNLQHFCETAKESLMQLREERSPSSFCSGVSKAQINDWYLTGSGADSPRKGNHMDNVSR